MGYIILNGGFINSNYEVVKTLDGYDVNLVGAVSVTTFTATKNGNVELIPSKDTYNVKLIGQKGGKYTFELTDEEGNIYSFEYHYDKKEKTTILNRK